MNAASLDTRNASYQDLKSRIHQELLNRLNLERLTRVEREDAEPEIRTLIAGMLERERDRTPLSLFERESLVNDVLNELFGLGPLEALLRDPTISDILVNRFDQVYIERERPPRADRRRRSRTTRHLMRIIERIVSTGRPPHRRVEPDGRRPPARTARASTRSFRRSRSTAPVLSIRRFRTDARRARTWSRASR